MRNPDDYASDQQGKELFWRDEDGTMVVKGPNVRDGGTAFRPWEGKIYFNRQVENLRKLK